MCHTRPDAPCMPSLCPRRYMPTHHQYDDVYTPMHDAHHTLLDTCYLILEARYPMLNILPIVPELGRESRKGACRR